MLIALACAGLLGGTAQSACAAEVPERPPVPRATWLWKHAGLHTDAGRRSIVADARSLGLNEIYLFVSIAASDEHLESLAEMARVARAEGLGIAWVLGDPSWAGAGGDEPVARALEKLALLAERSGGATSRVQFDVEPYLLPEWATDRHRVITRYLAVAGQLAAGSRALGLEPWLAIPFWFDKLEVEGRPLHELVTDLADGVVVMAYMNQLSKISDVAWTETHYAERVGGRLVIALETKCIQPAHNSYCVRGAGALQADLEGLERAFGGGALEAIALHDFEGLRTLVEKRPP